MQMLVPSCVPSKPALLQAELAAAWLQGPVGLAAAETQQELGFVLYSAASRAYAQRAAYCV
jgi:hypothetical protein